MKAKHPITRALMLFGCTLAMIVVVFIVGSIATVTIFGDSDEASWGFTLCFMVFAPIALLTGFTLAVKRFVRERRAQRTQSETNAA
jgi:uncharacterized membrane protein YhaH (DUF805 family)